jgi:rhodanese-related sulfurtransferase
MTEPSVHNPAITLDQLLARARERLERVAPQDLDEAMRAGAMVVDVRTAEQRERDGELPGAHLIDLTVLEWRLAPSSRFRPLDFPDTKQVILVCSEGYSSSLAAARLQDLGLSNATDLAGGFLAWKTWVEDGGPIL